MITPLRQPCPHRGQGREKNLETCAECIDYEKCETLTGFHSIPLYKPAKDKADMIRSRF